MTPQRRSRAHRWTTAVAIGLSASGLSGCATGLKELPYHPQQERLERTLVSVLPVTQHPDLHYWPRVCEPGKASVGLAVLPQRHIYLATSLIDQADDAVLTALIAHGVAHHQLHHAGQRTAVSWLEQAAFKAGGFFVPGLSYGYYIGGPITEVVLNAGQESQADAQTVAYLTRMGRSSQDLLRALEFLVAHGYSERVGRIILHKEDFTNRIADLQRRPPAESHPDSTD